MTTIQQALSPHQRNDPGMPRQKVLQELPFKGDLVKLSQNAADKAKGKGKGKSRGSEVEKEQEQQH